MLVRSFMVREMVPVDSDAFASNPAEYSGEWATNPEGDVGEVVSEHLVPIPDEQAPGGIRLQVLLGVLWGEANIPAISYKDPMYLENVDHLYDDDEEEQEEEEFDDFPEDENGERTV